jgi:cytochrome c oxidase subunit 2
MSFEQQFDDIEEDIQHPEAPFFSRAAGKIFIIWLILTAAGVLIGIYAPHHLLQPLLSPQGGDVWATMVVFTVLAAPVAAFVYAVAFYSLLAWRHKSDDPDVPPPDGAPQRGNGPMTILWLGISTFLCVVLLFWGITVWSSQQVTHPNTLQVNVTGQQWVWTYSYPGTGVQTRYLELPINRPVQFNVTSEDVTHGFWPAALGVQVDANPGEITVIRATPNRLGKFTVQCSQLCGLYHSFMNDQAAIVTTRQFAAWLQGQGASPASANQVADISSSSGTTTAMSS